MNYKNDFDAGFYVYNNEPIKRVFSGKNEILLADIINLTAKRDLLCGNLWQNFLADIIASDENIFTLKCERRKAPQGSISDLAKHDLKIFMNFFRHEIPEQIRNFQNPEQITMPIYKLSQELSSAKTLDEFYATVTNYYANFGLGTFGLHGAFRLENGELQPVQHVGEITLDGIIGYEIQKRELISNTEAFLSAKPANNVLLYGDGGTGKSSSVKALLNKYYSQGLRVIEIYKHQFQHINSIVRKIRNRNYRFIIFIDDLSFEENESEYKYLKAIIEGGIETKPENILIYATSNRRHIVREIWRDRDDMEHNGDVHRSDTIEEKLSLASRFGIAINYSSPDRKTYHEIIKTLAKNSGLQIPTETLLKNADAWEIRHGGKSGRAARQYIDYLLGHE